MNIIYKNFGNIALLALVTQYMQFIPIEFETQPLIGFIVAVLSLPVLLRRLRPTYVFYILLVVILGLFSSFVSGISFFDSIFALSKYLFPILFLSLLFVFNQKPSTSFFTLIILFFWTLALVYLFGYSEVFVSFFQRYTLPEATRGFSFLCPEQSYAAMMLIPVYFLAKTINQKNIFWQISILFFILLTKSAIGFVCIFLIILMEVNTLTSLVLPISGFLYLKYFGSESRLHDLVVLFNSLDTSNLIYSFVYYEPSGANRLIVNFISIYEGIFSLIGYGFGSFQTKFAEVLYRDHYNLISHHEILSALTSSGGNINPQCYLSSVIFELGLFALPMLLIILKLLDLRCIFLTKANFFLLCLLMIFLFYQGQITSLNLPFMIYLCSYHLKKVKV